MSQGQTEPMPDDLSPEDTRLLDAYLRVGVPADELPYSPQIDELLSLLGESHTNERRLAVFARLLQLRKAGRAPALSRFGPIKGLPELSDPEIETLSRLVIERVGSIGRRDRLPYSTEFSSLRGQFETLTGREFEDAEIWRLVLRRAKNPPRNVAEEFPDEDDAD